MPEAHLDAQWQWAAGSQHGAEGINVATDLAGNIFATAINYGNFSIFGTDTIPATSSGAGSVAMIVKYDPTGNVKWVHGVLDGQAAPIGVTTDQAGNSYFFGSYSSAVKIGGTTYTPSGICPFFLIKYDPNGNIKWVRNCNGRVSGGGFYTVMPYGGVTADSMGNIYIATTMGASVTMGTTTLTSAGGTDVFLAKYDTLGNLQWAKNAGGPKDENVTGIAVSPTGTIYVTGVFYSATANFGGTSITNPGATTNSAMFIAKYDATGNVLWVKSMGGQSEHLDAIATDQQGNFYITGRFPQASFTFGSTTLTNPYIRPEIFTTKYDSSGTVLWAQGITTPAHVLLEIDAFTIVTDPCGNVWMCGRMDSMVYAGGTPIVKPAGYWDAFFMMEYSSSGALMDHTILRYGGDDGAGIACDRTGNVFVCVDYDYGPFTVGATTLVDAIPGTLYEDLFIAKYRPASGAGDTTYLATKDTALCAAVNLVLTGPAGHDAYLWNTGATGQVYTATDTGTYWVIATDQCAMSMIVDTFHIKKGGATTTFSLGADTVACGPVTLTVPVTGAPVSWQDGSTGTTFTAAGSGTYVATVNDNGCTFSDTIVVSMPALSQHLQDSVFCTGQQLQMVLSANVPAGAEVHWNTGSTAASIKVTDTGTYKVVVTQGNCADSASCHVGREVCDCGAYLPNAFTPDGDGKNEYYHPETDRGCELRDYFFAIYNRWGQQVFKTNDPAGKWDGKLKGVPAEMGTYMYYLKYTAGAKNVKHFQKGDVTLVR